MRKELVKRLNEPKTIGDCYEKFRIEKKALLLKDNYCLAELKHFCTRTECSFDDDVKCITEQLLHNYTEILHNYAYKIASINHYLSAMRTILYYFMKNGWLDEFKISLLKGQEERLKTYTEDELAILLRKPKAKDSFVDWRSWAIISFLISTGCRASTLNAIHTEDIDYKNQEVIYRHLKNKKVSVIPLSNALIKTLNDFKSNFDLSESEYLFCEVNLNPMTVGALEQSIHRYCNKRKVKYKGIHTFRHTFACQWIRNNGNPMILQKFLTHSTLDMTKKYIHLFSTDMHKDLELYNPLDTLIPKSKQCAIRRIVQNTFSAQFSNVVDQKITLTKLRSINYHFNNKSNFVMQEIIKMKIDTRAKAKQIIFQLIEEYFDGDYDFYKDSDFVELIEELRCMDLDIFMGDNPPEYFNGLFDENDTFESLTKGMVPHSEMAKRLALDVRKERRKD